MRLLVLEWKQRAPVMTHSLLISAPLHTEEPFNKKTMFTKGHWSDTGINTKRQPVKWYLGARMDDVKVA